MSILSRRTQISGRKGNKTLNDERGAEMPAVEIVDGLEIHLTNEQYDSLLGMGWSKNREIDINRQLIEIEEDGGILNDFLIRIGRRFEGLQKKWSKSTHPDTILVEFKIGSSAEFGRDDYEVFVKNDFPDLCPFGNFIMYGVLFVDKNGIVYEFGDWNNFSVLGYFSEFIVGMLDERFSRKNINLKFTQNSSNIWS